MCKFTAFPVLLVLALSMALMAVIPQPAVAAPDPTFSGRWTADKANGWYAQQPWLLGCNFTPSSAVNQLKIWQVDIFDPKTIDRKLTKTIRFIPLTLAAAPSLATASAAADELVAFVILIAGQLNADGVAALATQTNRQAGMAEKHPTIPKSTVGEVRISVSEKDYPRSFIWRPGKDGPFERLTPGRNLSGCCRGPNRHDIELPLAMLLEQRWPTSSSSNSGQPDTTCTPSETQAGGAPSTLLK